MITNTLINLEKLLGLRNNEITPNTLLLEYGDGLMLELNRLRPLNWYEYNMFWRYSNLPFGWSIITYPRGLE